MTQVNRTAVQKQPQTQATTQATRTLPPQKPTGTRFDPLSSSYFQGATAGVLPGVVHKEFSRAAQQTARAVSTTQKLGADAFSACQTTSAASGYLTNTKASYAAYKYVHGTTAAKLASSEKAAKVLESIGPAKIEKVVDGSKALLSKVPEAVFSEGKVLAKFAPAAEGAAAVGGKALARFVPLANVAVAGADCANAWKVCHDPHASTTAKCMAGVGAGLSVLGCIPVLGWVPSILGAGVSIASNYVK
jgi:hypothetical protein